MIFDFPERFRYLRQSKNLAQSQLASLIGVDRSTISSYESNIRQPSLDTLSRIADVFGVSTDYLLTGDIIDKDKLLLSEKLDKLTPQQVRLVENIIDECIALYSKDK